MADNSKYTKVFVKNLSDFTQTLDKVVDLFDTISKEKGNADEKLFQTLSSTADVMRDVALTLKKIDRIDKNINAIQKSTKILAQNIIDSNTATNESIKSINNDAILVAVKDQTTAISELSTKIDAVNSNIKDANTSKETGTFGKIKSDNKSITEGVKTVVLIAAAIIAIGLALKLVGTVDFGTVIALSVFLPILALTMSEISKIKGIDPKQILYVNLSLIAMVTSIVAVSWILMAVAPIGLEKLFTAIGVAITMIPLVYVFKILSTQINKIKLTSVLASIIVLPLIALAIGLTSWALSITKPIAPYTLLTVIGIGIATIFMAMTANSFSKINFLDMPKIIFMPLLLPLIAFAIAEASSKLSQIKPVDNIFAVLSASLAVAAMMIPFAIMMKFMKGVKPATAMVTILAVGVIAKYFPSILIEAAKVLGDPTNTKYMESMTLNVIKAIAMTSLALTIIGIATGVIFGIAKKLGVDKLTAKGMTKVGLVLIAMTGIVVGAAFILQEMTPMNLNTLISIGLTTASLAIMALGFGVINKIFEFTGITPKSAVKLGITLTAMSTAIMLSSLILAQGNYTNMPTIGFSTSMGILFSLMAIPIAIFGSMSLPVVAMGSAGLVVAAAGIAAAMFALSFAEPMFKKGGLVYLFIDAITYLASGLKDVITSFLGEVVPILIPMVEAIGNVLASVLKVVTGALPAIINAITPLVKVLGEYILPPIISIIKTIADMVLPIVQSVIGLLGKIVDGVVAIAQIIGDTIGKVLDGFTNAFSALIKAVNETNPAQMIAFAGAFVILSAALVPFLLEMVAGSLAIPTMATLAMTLGTLLEVAKTNFDGQAFATKLRFMGEGLSNFSNNLPGFFTSIGSSASSTILANTVLTISQAAKNLIGVDGNAFKTTLGVLADGLVEFTEKMNTVNLDNMKMVRVPGLIFDGEIPAPLLGVQIAATAADIVGKVKMTQADADMFVFGMKALAKGIGEFTQNLDVDSAKVEKAVKNTVKTGWFSNTPVIMLGLDIATKAADIVSKVKMDETEAKKFTLGMTTLAKGIGEFINNLKIEDSILDKLVNDTVGGGWFTSGTPKLLVGLDIAMKAADIVSKTVLDDTGRKNFETTLSIIPKSISSFIQGLSKVEITPDQLAQLANVFTFLQQYMGPLVALMPSIVALDGGKVLTNMSAMGTGVSNFVTGFSSLKLTDVAILGMASTGMKHLSEITFDYNNLNQTAVAFDKLSTSITRFTDVLKKYSDVIKKDNFTDNLKKVVHSLLTYSIIDTKALEEVNKGMETSVKRISDIMIKKEADVKVETNPIIETDLVQSEEETKRKEEETKKIEEAKRIEDAKIAEEKARIDASNAAAEQTTENINKMSSDIQKLTKSLEELISIMKMKN